MRDVIINVKTSSDISETWIFSADFRKKKKKHKKQKT